MPRTCTICGHPERHEIDTALVDRSASYRDIADRYGLAKTSVSRHVTGGHISALLVLAADAETAARADTLLDRMEQLQADTEALLDEVRNTDLYGVRLKALSEMRRNLEVIGEITKELDRTPTVNLHLSPEWMELRAVIVGALEPFPEARRNVMGALVKGENGGHA